MIVHLASEVAPFYKRGGLGDVVGALPKYLSERQQNVVISFFYENRMKGIDLETKKAIQINIQGIEYEFVYYHHRSEQVDYYFLNMSDQHIFSDQEAGEGDKLLEDGEKPYKHNSSFFIYIYFAKAALKLIDALKLLPEYLIFHDWHVCGCFAFRQLMENIRPEQNYTTILLIHNYEYQGEILPDSLHLLSREVVDELSPVLAKYGTATLLSLGLKNADYVATVSDGYAKELEAGVLPHTGLKFLELIKRKKIYALPNGIDPLLWSPQNSPYLSDPYDQFSALEMKKKAKKELLEKLQFSPADDPVILMMARLTEQKGITLLMNFWDNEETAMKNLEELLDQGVRLIVCGRPSGGTNGNVHKRFSLAAQRFPGRFCYLSEYNEELAHQLLAASDAVLCPSLFEPCGLVQLYGMSFGAIPVVRAVGGLRDTVKSYQQNPSAATGFYIEEFSHSSLCTTFKQLAQVYKLQPEEWNRIVKRTMNEDFSWEKVRKIYFQFFDQIREELIVEQIEESST